MSSLKHVVARRVHLERQPPAGRPKAVERRKDFKVRAKQTKDREKLLKTLADKARDRNPEEFNFKMLKSRMVDGTFTRIKPELKLTNSQKQILKNNEIAQEVRLRKTQEELLEGQVVELARNAERTHIFYVHREGSEEGSDKEDDDDDEEEEEDDPLLDHEDAVEQGVSPSDEEGGGGSLSFLQ